MDREAWWAPVHGVTKSRTPLKQLSTRSVTPRILVKLILHFWEVKHLKLLRLPMNQSLGRGYQGCRRSHWRPVAHAHLEWTLPHCSALLCSAAIFLPSSRMWINYCVIETSLQSLAFLSLIFLFFFLPLPSSHFCFCLHSPHTSSLLILHPFNL